MLPIVYFSNRNGIPRVASTGVTVNTDNVSFTIASDRSFASSYNGLILFKLTQTIPTGTTDTLPIVFTSSVGTQPVKVLNGENYTVADYNTGIHLAYYESNTNTLQLLI